MASGWKLFNHCRSKPVFRPSSLATSYYPLALRRSSMNAIFHLASRSNSHWFGRARFSATLALLVALLCCAAHAQTRTWDGGGSGSNWSTSGNWSSNNVPNGTAEAALFTNHAVGQTKLTPNLSANVTIGQLQFSSTAPSYTITGASTLLLDPSNSFDDLGVLVASGAADQTISAAVVEFLASQTWEIDGAATLVVTGTIEDDSMIDYGLTKTGAGTLTFTGDVRYDGPTFVEGGTLILSDSNTSMLSAITVNDGRLRATTSANALGSSSMRNTITLAGGALELANDTGLTFGPTSRNTIVTGNTTIRSDRTSDGVGVTHTMGPLRIGAQTLTVEAGEFVTSGTAGMTFGTTTLDANGAVFDVASGANLTLGALTGNYAFSKLGSGRLTLNTAANVNRTSAAVTLSAGTLRLGSASALGTTAVPLKLGGGTLDLATNSTVNAHDVSVDGITTITSNRSTSGSGITHNLDSLAIGAHTLTVTAGANATSGTAGVTFGPTTLSGDATFNVVHGDNAAAKLTLGAVGEAGGARGLTKAGDGTLLLAATNSYLGNTTVLAGRLSLTNPSLADAADLFLSTGSTLELLFNGDPDIIGSLLIDGVPQSGGIWGSLLSNATHKSDLLNGPGLLLVSTIVPPVLVGDYNEDGDVNAADYTVWRNHLDEDFDLPNRDPLNLGNVNVDDYNSWKINFGATSAAGQLAATSTVPEPSTWLLALLAAMTLVRLRNVAIRRKALVISRQLSVVSH
jgi:autotransporter-associated beta strand protein